MILDTLKRLILPDTSLHCPRCEKSLTQHDDAACARRMSRRYFFGVAAGAAAAIVAAPALPAGKGPRPEVWELGALPRSTTGLTTRHTRTLVNGVWVNRIDCFYGYSKLDAWNAVVVAG